MSLLRKRGRHRETVELNITAFMNLMVVLVPFLLITAVFSQVAILDLNLPTDGQPPVEPTEPQLQLEITVRESRIDVGDRSTGLLTVIENTASGYDLEELGDYLEKVKQRFPDKSDATLLLEPDISYQTLVAVMDRVRVLERLDAGSNRVQTYELFPEISIGDAPLRN
ncbi:MAG TPA: biopolymer transporter ExbD [Gammaproteobacteria bacterium]|nr:biopolymer transporter ExbD [Gammaproteobacteria bacterium]